MLLQPGNNWSQIRSTTVSKDGKGKLFPYDSRDGIILDNAFFGHSCRFFFRAHNSSTYANSRALAIYDSCYSYFRGGISCKQCFTCDIDECVNAVFPYKVVHLVHWTRNLMQISQVACHKQAILDGLLIQWYDLKIIDPVYTPKNLYSSFLVVVNNHVEPVQTNKTHHLDLTGLKYEDNAETCIVPILLDLPVQIN